MIHILLQSLWVSKFSIGKQHVLGNREDTHQNGAAEGSRWLDDPLGPEFFEQGSDCITIMLAEVGSPTPLWFWVDPCARRHCFVGVFVLVDEEPGDEALVAVHEVNIACSGQGLGVRVQD